MAATLNKRWPAAPLGGVKVETLWITSDGTNDDTSLSLLMANPEAVEIALCNSDAGGTADPASVTFSGKALTLRDCQNGRDYLIKAWGY